MLDRASSDLPTLLHQISIDYPNIQLVEGPRFAWNSRTQQLTYTIAQNNSTKNILSFLHELGHAILGHKDYQYDIELLLLEVAAWKKARELSARYHIELDEDYTQDCLDTYRDWLHLRATCPTCYARSLQASAHNYHCLNCQTEWSVTRRRLCRPYRLKVPQVT